MTLTQDQSAALLWYARLRESSNAGYLPLFFDRHRYLVLKGGGGSGKSIFAGRKILERASTEPGHRILVCRKVARTLRESCFQQLQGQLRTHYPQAGAALNRTEMRISFPNGSEILFAGLDDVEKLKSIYAITSIWVEEASELLESDFNQLDIRLRGTSPWYKQMILTFNPISITHWLKARFFDRRDERALVHESTYRDNRFLDEEAVRTLECFANSDPYYYQVYCLGQWGVTGKTVFPPQNVAARLAAQVRPRRRGGFLYEDTGITLENITWEETEDGPALLYKEPEPGVPYVIGCDTAGEGSDSFVAQVLDNRTGEQVATLRQPTDEDLFARQVFCLGRHYNNALVGIETNFSTYPVRELERLGYWNQYVRETVDDYDHSPRRAYGFQTNAKTRPVAIAALVRIMRETPELVCDKTTLEEMLTFIRTPQLRPEAEPGAHDDCVMALAIAHAIRDQQPARIAPQPAPVCRKTWDKSLREDYRRASPEERKRILDRCGG